MPGSGTRTFLEPDDYEASLRHAQIESTIIPRGKFEARLTWAGLHYLEVLRCDEPFPRFGYISLRPQLSFMVYPAPSGAMPVWRGAKLHPEDMMFYDRGGRLHQATLGPCVWCVIALHPVQLEHYGFALSGKAFSPPPGGNILRPSASNAARLRRLHSQICRLAETKAKLLSHSEVAHALEQGLIQALVTCLTDARTPPEGSAKRHHAAIMVRFEEVLAERLGEPLPIAKLCELIGASEGALRSSCAEFLGVSPSRYVLLRQLRVPLRRRPSFIRRFDLA
jgi:AraC-like DNA-binding protein